MFGKKRPKADGRVAEPPPEPKAPEKDPKDLVEEWNPGHGKFAGWMTEWWKIRRDHSLPEGLERDLDYEKCTRDFVVNAQRFIGVLVAQRLEKQAYSGISSGMLKTVEGKQLFARTLAAELRRDRLSIAHPETLEPCTLVAVSDTSGGRFVLESRLDKKRSMTTNDITTLFPMSLLGDYDTREQIAESKKGGDPGVDS